MKLKGLLTLKIEFLFCITILAIMKSTAFWQKIKTKTNEHWWFPVDNTELYQRPSSSRRRKKNNKSQGRQNVWVASKSIKWRRAMNQWAKLQNPSKQQQLRQSVCILNTAKYVCWETHERKERSSLCHNLVRERESENGVFLFHNLCTCHFVHIGFTPRISTVIRQYKHSILDLEW